MGYRVVIAESFGDIFHSNCFKNAVLPVALPADAIDVLLEAAAAHDPFAVDATSSTVSAAGHTFHFELPEFRRTALLEGLDDLDVVLRIDVEISAFEDEDRSRRPWVHTL